MYLKALEIQGFKSFPEKTLLTFEKDITAIVGPNGSGKSNISDAILWVMGEQRSKALRGTKMEDVIFGGTETRNPLGIAQVTLIIDNSGHIFDSESSEISLTRRYYRNGDSEYYINKEPVRLKDINTLLMDTGLGRDGYSIIGQGRISEIISAKSTDRREIFEEAAGISRFRYRKEEAERKLEKTEENLLRINDKIDELELQVLPLKKQAETAKKFLILRDELRVKEISLWMENLDRIHEKTSGIQTEYDTVNESLTLLKKELEALYASSESLAQRMRQKDVDTEKVRERLSAAETLIASHESDAAVLKANIASSNEKLERLNDDISKQAERANEINSGIEANNLRITEIDKNISDCLERISSNGNVIEGCKMKLSSRENILNSLKDKAAALSLENRKIEDRISLLEEMQKDYEGYSNAVKAVMKDSERGRLSGIHGPVAELIKTDPEYSVAIETALAAASQNIIVSTSNDGKNAIEMLKRTNSGRATFLPIDTIKPQAAEKMPEDEAGFIASAEELVICDEQYLGIIGNLLGKTAVVEELSDAIAISKKYGNKLKYVTLDGQVINPGGSMTGGSLSKNAGILSRSAELERLRKELDKALKKEKELDASVQKANTDYESVKYRLTLALEDNTGLTAEKMSLEAEKKAVRDSNTQLGVLLSGLALDTDSRLELLKAAEAEISGFEASLEEKNRMLSDLKHSAGKIRDEIDVISKNKLELESRRTKADKEAQTRNEAILDAERKLARIEQKKLTAELEEKQIIDRLWDNYELSHSAASAIREKIDSVQKYSKEISELKSSIASLGTPNIGAIEEYERVSVRYDFLTGQRDDINKAKKELLSVIDDVTGQMTEIFLSKFDEINLRFKETFAALFGGGKAELILEDMTNVLECGIEIKVQPPGKALSTLTLLSGGEMAFVAIALYFAILKVRPTPFCVMDEIEAALDEENVNRYADYMRSVSDKTQFIVITHRRGTMEQADMLYGVTMQEKGVSKVLHLNLEEAKKTTEV